MTFFRATGIKRIDDGGGDDSEEITVHEVPLRTIQSWLGKHTSETTMVDPKVFTGLYFLK